MNIKVIAFSADIPELKNNGLFDIEIAAKYPGASLSGYVKKICNSSFHFYTADVALALVKCNKLNPSSIAIVQHNQDSDCAELIKMGSLPLLLTMYESPLYSGIFYDKLLSNSFEFKHLMVFGGDLLDIPGSMQAFFPCFNADDLKFPVSIHDWSERKFASMILGNKYVLTKPITFATDFRDIAWWMMKKFRNLMGGFALSKSLNVEDLQLQDKRLEIIQSLLRHELLDLYGNGVDRLYRIPPKMRDSLSILMPKKEVDSIPYGDGKKEEYINRYKFNICFENMAYPGYVTEKIIDAIKGKSIPVYWGAPDILNYVPANLFIDASKFADIKELIAHLLSVDKDNAKQIIENGQRFLSSPDGYRFSYQSVACEILKILLPYSEQNLHGK